LHQKILLKIVSRVRKKVASRICIYSKKYENQTLLSGREFANINAPSPKKLLLDISAKHITIPLI